MSSLHRSYWELQQREKKHVKIFQSSQTNLKHNEVKCFSDVTPHKVSLYQALWTWTHFALFLFISIYTISQYSLYEWMHIAHQLYISDFKILLLLSNDKIVAALIQPITRIFCDTVRSHKLCWGWLSATTTSSFNSLSVSFTDRIHFCDGQGRF